MFLGDSLVSSRSSWTILTSANSQGSYSNKTILEELEAAVPVKIDCIRIVQLLSSNGFVPFAIGLHSVLNRIIADQHKNLT
ncbi:unnamed protein product [Brassica oleracea var. botrytis]